MDERVGHYDDGSTPAAGPRVPRHAGALALLVGLVVVLGVRYLRRRGG